MITPQSIILLVRNSSSTPTLRLSNNLGSQNLASSISLELSTLVPGDGPVVAGELHVLAVVADFLSALLDSLVVEVDVVEEAVLGQDATGLELNLGSDVVNAEFHTVNTEINAGIEVEQVENFGIKVDFGGDVLDLNRDLTNRDIGVEINIRLLVKRRDAAVGVFRLVDSRLIIATTVQTVAVVAIAFGLCSDEA
ncbi:hypothetical protein HG530_012436 [Fusarium avenaceum]|nr:hypothetical protein HG530_012436 [Fusarium avenaceum]